MKKYKVIKERVSEFPNPITVKKDTKVECIEFSNSEGEWAGWVLCRTHNNEGWLPHQILSINESMGLVIEDYCAEEFDLKFGEILYTDKEINGWIWCYKRSDPGKYAWAPLNHIECIEQ